MSMTFAQHHADIKIKNVVLKNHLAIWTQVVYVLCLYYAHVSGQRLQDHLVLWCINKILDEFDFRYKQTTDYGVS